MFCRRRASLLESTCLGASPADTSGATDAALRRARRRVLLAAAFTPFALASLALLAGCGERHAPAPVQAPLTPSATAAASSEAPRPSPSASVAVADAGPPAPYAGPWIGATVLQAPVMSDMEWPADKKNEREGRAVRIGYLRFGERTPVIAEPHKKANCAEGWYELVAGGFVCGKYATLDLEHPRVKLAHGPDYEGPLPYAYGINVANGTPLYHQVPSREERLRIEPWLARPKKPKTDEDNNNPYAAPRPDPTAAADAGAPGIGENAGDTKSDSPWWEKDAPDGGPPSITLEDLQENDGPVARRMVKGFFLSLDHQFGSNGAMWWKTVNGLVAPADRIFVTKPATEMHGLWLGKDDATYPTKNVPARRIDKLPIAFVLRSSKHWTLDDARKHASVADGVLDRFDAIGLTGETARAGGAEYWETDGGYWIRAADATRTDPGPAPEKLGDHEKWIDVNLRRQTLVAFEGATPVYATLISSGRKDHDTPPGSFRIREKHISATMDGDADTAADGPYSIEDVPYIQYFNAGYALHGAFWHAAFGQIKSHGCVNLAPWDAKSLFGWTEPQLPEGWHAVFSTKERPGTRVVLHEKPLGT